MVVDVVGVGHCAYDILAIVTGTLDFDSVAMIPLADLVHDGGGQVGTALTALGRLGARTAYIGVLGNDREGRWLRDRFLEEGVDVARIRQSDDTGTNVCLILVDQPTARRAMLCHRRVAPEDLVLDDLDRQLVQSSRVLHLDGQFMPAAIQAAKWAHEAGGKVCYDGNHPRPGLEQLLPLVDWLVVAAPFPAAYTGLQDPVQAARALLDQGSELVAVTYGERGCRVWTAEGELQVAAFHVDAKDTTGAGDAFHGAFIYGMLQGWDLPQVARFANAVAGLNCLTLGGRRGLPSLQQVQRFLAGSPAIEADPSTGAPSP